MTKKLITPSKPGLLLPGLGAHMQRAVPRGVIYARPRADATDPKALIEALNKAVIEMRSDFETQLKGKANSGDVVAIEKQAKYDADISMLVAAVESLTAQQAALKAGAGGTDKILGDMEPTSPEAMKAFKTFMREGDQHLSASVKASLNKAVDAEGGYLAPIEWDRTIIGQLKQINPIRANSRQMSISTAGFKKLFTDRAIGSGWVGETASRTATSTPAIASLDFSPGELYANPAISQQLLQDSAINIEQWLADEVQYEFSRQEGIAFLSGDGTNKPFGILTYVTGAANAAKHPWGAIATVISGHATLFTGDGIISLMYDLPSEFTANAKFYTARSSMGAIRKLKDGQGNYLWQQNYAAGEPQTISGSPIVEVPGMPAAAAGTISALYGDMEATYLVFDRIGLSVLRDPFTNKPFVHFYTTKRVGGGVYNPQPMRALKIAAS